MTVVIGVFSKHVARGRSASVSDSAALALVISDFAFDTDQSWCGALPELPIMVLIVLFGTAVFITDRVNKMPAVLAVSRCALPAVHAYGVRERSDSYCSRSRGRCTSCSRGCWSPMCGKRGGNIGSRLRG